MMTIVPEMVADFIDESHKPQLKTLAKGATSRKITIAVRRTYVKRSLVAALKESILAAVPSPTVMFGRIFAEDSRLGEIHRFADFGAIASRSERRVRILPGFLFVNFLLSLPT